MTVQQQLIMLGMPNALELFSAWWAEGYCLSDEAEVAMFNAPNSEALVKAYISHHPLCEEAIDAMFEHKNSEEFLIVYIRKHPVSDKFQIKMMEHPSAKRLAMIYMENRYNRNALCEQAVRMMFALDNSTELVATYVNNYLQYPSQCEYLLERISSYPNAEIAAKFAIMYENVFLTSAAQLEILKLKNAEELIRLYIKEIGVSKKSYYAKKYPIRDPFFEKMATMSDGAELMNICMSCGLM